MKHRDEGNIKCPHCNYEDKDSWEFEGNEGEESRVNCKSCEKEFYVERNVTVTYSTSKIECEEGKHNYKLESYFESKYDYINRQRIAKPESEWRWFRIEVCEICDDREYVEITKDQYKKQTED